MTLKLVVGAILLLGCIFFFSSCYGTRKTLLFENWVHQWKVYFVKTTSFSVGTTRYFEVYYKGQQLILPKETTDGHREVSQFISAVAVDSSTSYFGMVIVTFEGDFIDDDGVPYRTFVTLNIRPGRDNDLLVRNPCNGKETIIGIE